jgi:hypothetical protein
MDEEQRRTMFAALVAAQDRGLTVVESRRLVASEYGVSTEQVRVVELEGEREQWPPLGD